MIDGIQLLALEAIFLKDGSVLKMISTDSEFYTGFGEIYFSEIRYGGFKGWKKHLKQTQNLTVPYGEVEFKLFDDRPYSSTKGLKQSILLGRNKPSLLIIPPNIWYGFSSLIADISLIANLINMPYYRSETISLPPGVEPFLD